VRSHFTGGILPHSFLMFVMKKDFAFIHSPGIKLIHETATRAKRNEQEIYQHFLTDGKI